MTREEAVKLLKDFVHDKGRHTECIVGADCFACKLEVEKTKKAYEAVELLGEHPRMSREPTSDREHPYIMPRTVKEEGYRQQNQLRKEAKLPWTIEEAVEFLRPLEIALRLHGFGLALGGSVLTKGKSDKDLDIVVFPLDSGLYDIMRARGCFDKAGMNLLWENHDILRFWKQGNPGCTDAKHVEVWEWKKHRIDVFFLR